MHKKTQADHCLQLISENTKCVIFAPKNVHSYEAINPNPNPSEIWTGL